MRADTTLPMSAETLARTLRAVAAELERDPALARRVASAVSASTDGESVVPFGGRPDTPAERPDRIDTPADTNTYEPAAPKAPKRASRAFTPRLVTGAGPELGTGIPDPFALRDRLGRDGLRAALDELRLGTLRAIVREHRLDPSGKLVRQGDAAKLREAILAAVAAG